MRIAGDDVVPEWYIVVIHGLECRKDVSVGLEVGGCLYHEEAFVRLDATHGVRVDLKANLDQRSRIRILLIS